MGRGATKAAGNVYYQARIEAAKWNGSLSSREGAAEALGVSVDTVKNIELGLHKCVPVDLVVLMADLYNAPYLLGAYCKNECPIGCNYPIATMMTPVERTTLKLINLLDPGKLEDVKRELISIAEDGEITEDEIPSLQEILEYADKLTKSCWAHHGVLRMQGHGARLFHRRIYGGVPAFYRTGRVSEAGALSA